MLVSVGPCVLVPEADDVTQFVNDDAQLVAVLADRDRLGTVTALADKRATSASMVARDRLHWRARECTRAGLCLYITSGRVMTDNVSHATQ